MQLLQYTLLTLVVAFFIQFWVISVITSKRSQNTVGKFYLSMVSASIMGILEVMIYDTYKSSVSLFYYLVLGLMVYLFVYMYKSQTGIDEADYLKQMMESHSREDGIIENGRGENDQRASEVDCKHLGAKAQERYRCH